jgi:hypothetical protein
MRSKEIINSSQCSVNRERLKGKDISQTPE